MIIIIVNKRFIFQIPASTLDYIKLFQALVQVGRKLYKIVKQLVFLLIQTLYNYFDICCNLKLTMINSNVPHSKSYLISSCSLQITNCIYTCRLTNAFLYDGTLT